MKVQSIILALALTISAVTVSFAQDGEQLFKTTCTSCHTIGKGKLVGPDLKDVQNRHTKEWILKWVKSSQTLVKAGDPDAVKLFADNNRIPMPDHALDDKQIGSILDYITTTSANIAAGKTTVQANSPGAAVASGSQMQNGNPLSSFNFTEYLLLGLLIILLIVIWVLSKTIKSLSAQLVSEIKNHNK